MRLRESQSTAPEAKSSVARKPSSEPAQSAKAAKLNSELVTWRNTLSPLQQEVVFRLQTEKRIPRSELVQMVEGGGRSFVRFMDSLKESIEAAGLKKTDIYNREMEGFGADKKTFYVAGPKLLKGSP